MLKQSWSWGSRKVAELWSDSLYRNSFWLMAGSFSMAGIGFFYWMMAARLYSPEQIGLATTLLSAASLVNSLASLGMGTTLIRFLPTSEIKVKKINTGLTAVTVMATITGIIYIVGLPIWTNKLMFLQASVPTLLITAAFFPVYSINALTDYIFVAFREAFFVFVSNITQSVTKIITLILLATLGTWGLIGSSFISMVVAVILCLAIIGWRYKVDFKPTLDRVVLEKVRKFALGNYFSGLISGLPGMVLPIIITNNISASQTAYFYMPNMIITLLNIIPSTIARSYFTESSHNNQVESFKKPMLTTYSILVPAILFLVIFGKLILSFFGKNYAAEGYDYLVLTCISVLIGVVSGFLGYKLLILQKMGKLILVQSISSAGFILLVFELSKLGITGVGYSFILSKLFELILLTLILSENEK